MKYITLLAVAAMAIVAAPRLRAQPAAPGAEALGLARILVEKTGAGGEQALSGMVLPVPEYLRALGVTAPEQMRAMTHEVIMPALNDHADELTEIQVKSYATLLTIPEMKAAIAFYDSPAGHDLVNFRFRGVQANMPAGAALIARLRPEIELRARDVARAHGWPPPG